MLSVVISIVLVTPGQGVAAPTRAVLPAPTLGTFVMFDPPGLTVDWDLVISDQDPVLGYKVKFWEATDTKTYRYKTVNGEKKLVEEIVKPKGCLEWITT